MLAFATRAAAGLGQFPAVAEHVTAVRTAGGFEDKPAAAIMYERFGDVKQMVFDLPLRNAEHLRQLVGGQSGADQQIDEALARRPVGERHKASIVRKSRRRCKTYFAGRRNG